MALDRVVVSGDRFVDLAGRQVILRGVNLGGDCKLPYPDGGTHVPTDFSDHKAVSFVGRPFPLAEADEHLARLRHWGFNVVRLLTTWEAIEHAGPGLYDQDYLAYFTEVVRRCGEHGLYVFIDFHQDVWSRMTGGDGAPGWTFEAAGLDYTKFHAAGAAHIMQAKYDYAEGGRQAAYPQMSWGRNYRLPAAAIMWTLFWGGRMFTPELTVEGENIQTYLQGRYLAAMREVAGRVADLPHVLGFDTLNEPGTGWMGEPLSYRHVAPTEHNPTPPRPGVALSPLDALAAAQGLPVRVPILKRDRVTGAALPAGEHVLNPDGISIWAAGRECPFAQAGVYRVEHGSAVPLKEDHFRTLEGRLLDIAEDGFGPFFHRVAEVTRAENAEWILFAEIDAMGSHVGSPFPSNMPERSVNADHWYDATTLFLKTFNARHSPDLLTGEIARSPEEVRARFVRQLAQRAAPAKRFSGGAAPVLIGEFGIPYDLDEGEAYRAWAGGRRDDAIWAKHEEALALMYDALDELLLNSTQWNYTASNRNDLMIGDGWNQEDLSIFSRDQQWDGGGPDSGGRAINGFCRPYVRRAQGQLRRVQFEPSEPSLTVEIDIDPSIRAPTEIYLPRRRFPYGATVDSIDRKVDLEGDGQLLRLWSPDHGPLRLTLRARA